MTMTQQVYGEAYSGSGPENYQRYFVPTIGRPVADDLIEVAGLRQRERVLDVACGTGVVTRLAIERVGPHGSVAGLDVNPGMLQVARTETPPDLLIYWYEASAEAMPLPEDAFDVVLCQMGLQFITNKLAAVREMRRVLVAGGRIHLNAPGPKPPLFAVMKEVITRHLGSEVAGFTDLVFSLHDVDAVKDLLEQAGFHDIEVKAATKRLSLPPPAEFLWQYVYSTPMACAATTADEKTRQAMERDFCDSAASLMSGHAILLEVGMTTASARK